jgi:hypothetical protein
MIFQMKARERERERQRYKNREKERKRERERERETEQTEKERAREVSPIVHAKGESSVCLELAAHVNIPGLRYAP